MIFRRNAQTRCIPKIWLATKHRRLQAFGVLIILIGGLGAVAVQAHTRWLSTGTTPSRDNRDNNKFGPCGSERGDTPAIFNAGETVTLHWETTIYHQGYFRIAFSPAGDQAFDDNIIMDNIPERNGVGEYTAEVTLPNEPCDDCTLQLIQVMLDRNPPTNYYSCADINLVADIPEDLTPPGPIVNLRASGNAPSLTLRWENPPLDFAGVVAIRSLASESSQPVVGSTYQLGDAVGQGNVVYVGNGQQLVVSDAEVGEQYTLYSFDSAGNFATGVTFQVVEANVINSPPSVSLAIEQAGHNDGLVFSADGRVIIQATVTDPDPGDVYGLNWLVPMDVDSEVAAADQLFIRPEATTLSTFSVTAVAEDNGNPSLTGEATIALRVEPYSRYQPKIAVYQLGVAVDRARYNNGTITVTIDFEGPQPPDVDTWSVVWTHNIPGATQEGLSLSFEPSESARYQILAAVSSATAIASPELSQTVALTKPVSLGALSSRWLILLGLISVAAIISRWKRLQGRV